MIVICTRCQAKFRVADEKIGPRGAKVRCSRCQTVFLIHPDLGTMPATDEGHAPKAAPRGVDLEAPSPTFPTDNPFASNPVRAPAPPPLPQREAPPPLPEPAAFPPLDDPFSAAGPSAPEEPDPFATPPDPDPFAAPGGADPFGAQQPPFGEGPLAAVPEPGEPGPFALAAGPSPLPVTDLSDLGLWAPSSSPEAPAPAPTPVEPAAPPDPEDDGLSLEDRTTPPPRPVVSRGDAFPLGTDPFDGASDPFVAGGAFDPAGYAPAGEVEDLTLAREARDPAPHSPAPPPAQPAASPAQPAAAHAASSPRAAPAAAEDRIPSDRGSRVRVVAVNAVGLAALLLAALAIMAIWRNGGRLDAASLRPAALLGFARSDATEQPFVTRDVTSGLYERERAHPVLFVRGNVISRNPSPLPRVEVAVEVLRDGRVIARGSAIAGAVPTAEELHGARDTALLQALSRETASRAPGEVEPGKAIPFLVVLDDVPADLKGASLRLVATPGGGAP